MLSSNTSEFDGVFVYKSHTVSTSLEAPFPWKPGTRHSPIELQWPPKGAALSVTFQLAKTRVTAHQGLTGTMHYTLYVGIPLLAKSMSVTCSECAAADDIVIRSATVELLSVNAGFGNYPTHGSLAPGSDWGGSSGGGLVAPLLQAKTDQAHSAACTWQDDYSLSQNPIVPAMKDQGATEPALNCSYTDGGPGAHVNRNEGFESFQALLMVADIARYRAAQNHAAARTTQYREPRLLSCNQRHGCWLQSSSRPNGASGL